MSWDLPVLLSGGTITLTSILEPISNLSRRQTGRRGELALLCGIRVRILEIPFAEEASCALLEAVRLLFAIPDGSGQREFLADAVFVDGSWIGKQLKLLNENKWTLHNYLKVAREAFLLRDSVLPATSLATFHEMFSWICDAQVLHKVL